MRLRVLLGWRPCNPHHPHRRGNCVHFYAPRGHAIQKSHTHEEKHRMLIALLSTTSHNTTANTTTFNVDHTASCSCVRTCDGARGTYSFAIPPTVPSLTSSALTLSALAPQVLLKSVNSTHARLHRVDRKAWLCKSNAAGGDAARECVRSANRLRTTRHNVPRSSSLTARVDPPPRRPGGWGLADARKGDARGERSVWVVPLHRLAPSYQFSHRNYGQPSQNFEKSST